MCEALGKLLVAPYHHLNRRSYRSTFDRMLLVATKYQDSCILECVQNMIPMLNQWPSQYAEASPGPRLLKQMGSSRHGRERGGSDANMQT